MRCVKDFVVDLIVKAVTRIRYLLGRIFSEDISQIDVLEALLDGVPKTAYGIMQTIWEKNGNPVLRIPPLNYFQILAQMEIKGLIDSDLQPVSVDSMTGKILKARFYRLSVSNFKLYNSPI